MIYTTGTVSTVSGSAIVSGTGTKWTVNNPAIRSGTIILIKNGNANFIYMVDRVNSDTELVISQPATFTVENTSYSINLTEPNSYSDANNRMTAIASDTTYFLRAMDQWMMNNGVVTVELSNGQKVTLDSIKKMQGDIANKLDIKTGGNVTARVSANPISVTRDNSSFCNLYPAKDDSGMAFFQYNNASTWSGPLNIPKVKSGETWEVAVKIGQYITNYSNTDWAGLRLYKGNGEYGFIETNSTSNEIFTIGYRNSSGNNQAIVSLPRKNGEILTTGTTTIDSNGFIKKASPIININHDGTFTTNDESEGATVTRVAQGEYLIEGVLGFNSDAGWGGVDGGIEIPLDVNKQPLIWVDSEVMEDGSILVRTYHRTHPNAPKFARNDIDGYKDGDPIDIPDGRFISVRVQMPEQSIYNVRMCEMEEAQKAEEERRQKEEEMKEQYGSGENDVLL
ncbi:hypothetical protein KTP48_12830 [Proteus mirabilis]|uniref:phage tail fiber protein n=1 Tax=Proteus mirabilis TaxID=584 RepID=UPI001C2BD275|nr:hypothetical protein [Proteus mirabilis]MBU9979624.1 hypothetical protein [Proteus mirabilis]